MTRTRVRTPALGADGERIAVRVAEAKEQSPPGTNHAACRGLRILARWLVSRHLAEGAQELASDIRHTIAP